MNENKINYLLNNKIESVVPLEPYSDVVCDFFDELSKSLLKDKMALDYTDIVSFAFWCRRSNIEQMKNEYGNKNVRMGKGMVFHITPSNVPINFMFSFAFGLLAGNANIVRVSNKKFPQTDIMIRHMDCLFQEEKFEVLKKQNVFVSYERDNEITAYFSNMCSVRVIWGGDETIRSIREIPIPPRATEIVFSDRYSLGVIDIDSFSQSSLEKKKQLAKNFYNDTYLMDQNACSTPHLIVWVGDGNRSAEKEEFWSLVYEQSKNYPLEDIKVSEKYTMLCKMAIDSEEFDSCVNYDNNLYVVNLSELNEDITQYRGKFGLFYQYQTSKLTDIFSYITPKIQTIATYGVNGEELMQAIVDNHLLGVDRVVSFGKTLDIGVYWDGYDLITELSRIVRVN